MSRLTLAYPHHEIDPNVGDVFTQIEMFVNENSPTELTSTMLLDKAHWLNSRVKVHGLMVTLVDNNKTVWASGNADVDAWVNAEGVAVYVPV